MTRFVEKPWGREEIFAETDRYVGKILTVRAGQALSLQFHRVKDETLRVLAGTCEFHLASESGGDEVDVCVLGPGEARRIRPGVRHRLVALTDVTLVEVSTPEIDDVVRLDDRYGRAGT
jgi:mannose-6-phosphate isomerase-like protein (cupin superfamily)